MEITSCAGETVEKELGNTLPMLGFPRSAAKRAHTAVWGSSPSKLDDVNSRMCSTLTSFTLSWCSVPAHQCAGCNRIFARMSLPASSSASRFSASF